MKGEYLGVYDEKKILFDEYAQQYLDYCKANKAASTYERRERLNIRLLAKAFKGRYLFYIAPHMVEKYKALRLQSISPASVNRELACLKHMYTMVLEWGYVNSNPTKRVERLKGLPGRLRYLKPD